MQAVNVDELRATFLFEAFSDEQLQWLAARAEEAAFAAGAPVFPEGVPTDALWVLLAGQLRLTRTVGGREIVLETSDQPGTWGGWLLMFDAAFLMRLPLGDGDVGGGADG